MSHVLAEEAPPQPEGPAQQTEPPQTAGLTANRGSRLSASNLHLSYDREAVVCDLDLAIPDGKITTIVGPNGCGKSTVLRALARLHTPRSGSVLLDGHSIQSQGTKEVARKLGLLAQQPVLPDSVRVEDLVLRGRYPHQGLIADRGRKDEQIAEAAMKRLELLELRQRPVDELSGGQRQKVWLAMALAQETQLLLLDEPTTYLDLVHRRDIVGIIESLCRDDGKTLVLILHDLNDALQISDHVVLMNKGGIVAQGAPAEVLVPELLSGVFGVQCDMVSCGGQSWTLPRSRVLANWRGRGDTPSDRETRFGSSVHAERHSGGAVGSHVTSVSTEPSSSVPATAGGHGIETVNLRLSYGRNPILHDVTVSIPEGKVTALIGANASGKSTLLKAMTGTVPIQSGKRRLGGRDIEKIGPRGLARHMAVLGQNLQLDAEMPVEELVAFGRFRHQRWYRQWSEADRDAIDRALESCGLNGLRSQSALALSGGQFQRVRLAMALAQESPILFLDEPTTFLDMAQQVEVLDLIHELNRRYGYTIVAVLHELWQVARYAHNVVALKNGRIWQTGNTADVLRPGPAREIFGLDCALAEDPLTGGRLLLPLA